MRTAVSGGKPNNILFEIAHRLCLERVAKSNGDLVIYYDIESGWPEVITKEQNQKIIDSWNSIKPKKMINGKPIGTIIYWGTGSSGEKGNGWIEDMFNDIK